MITKDDAKKLAMDYISQGWIIEGDEPIILDDFTIEKAFGWIFFYSSQRFEETKNFSYALAGNAPIIVNKFDNSLHLTGTALETEHYILEYEKSLDRV